MNAEHIKSDLERPRPQRFTPGDAVFFVTAFVFIYSQLFQFPLTPIYFEGDNLFSVSNALRMLDGEVIYRDFFHLTPPGAELVYEMLFTAFGVKIWVLNLVILFLGMVQVWLLWFFSRKTLTGMLVYLPTALTLVIGYRSFGIDGSYRLFSVSFVLLAVVVLFNRRIRRNLIIAGVFCGLASFFVQTRGLVGVAGISFFLLWENYRQGFSLKELVKSGLFLTLPFAAVVLLTHSYFAWQAGFDNYYFAMVEFLQKHYKNDPLGGIGSYLSDLSIFQSFLDQYSATGAISRYFRVTAPLLFYYFLIPFVYIALLVYRRLRTSAVEFTDIDAKLMLLCCVGLTLAAGVSGPTALRLNHIAIPGAVILCWLLSRMSHGRQIGTALLSVLCVIGFAYVVQRQVVAKNYLDMPAGRAAFLASETFNRYKWIGENTKEGDVLFEAQHPSFYFPFHLKNPTPLSVMRDSEYTPRFQVASVVAALEKSRPNTIRAISIESAARCGAVTEPMNALSLYRR